MSGIKYLLDSCFVLGFFKKSHEVIAVIQKHAIEPEQCAISVINRIEVLGFAGLTANDERSLTTLLAQFDCVPLTSSVEQETIRLRKAHKIKLPDAIVLATTMVNGLQLLTLDKGLQKYI